MSVIADLRTLSARVLLLGTHPGIIQSMLDYDYMCGLERPSVRGIVTGGGRKTERYFWGEDEVIIPVYPSLDSLSDLQREEINAVLHVQSARRVLEGMTEALNALPNLKLGVIFAEQTPEAHSLELSELAHQKGVLITGPASVGILIPGVMKLGAIGGTQHPQIVSARIFDGGDTAVISTSGGMVNELIHTVTGSGLRVSFGLALGGDRFPLTSPAEVFLLAEADPATERIVYFGELGGQDEYEIAQLVADKKVTKPIFAYVAGTVAELFETPPQFGHAKAMASTKSETAAAKKEALREVGATVFDTFADLAPTLRELAGEQPVATERRTIGDRKKYHIISRISGDSKDGDVQLLGRDLRDTVENNTYASLVLSMLLGEKSIKSDKTVTFMDYVLKLLVDHGPYVSGAVNTIISARAGRDLVSSLATGLLTVGPRFGGAINGAAGAWLAGVNADVSPKAFVAQQSGVIPGIGHKKYRIDAPDPRVAALADFGVEDGRYLAFARGVEAVTTGKKSNLILNVDGVIAAVMLDLLETELGYTRHQLQELVDIEFFNAIFVLSRSVGFTAHYLDQRRHDEGLFRMSPDDIRYLG
jgi:ATP citrate (pro-S)-lyase